MVFLGPDDYKEFIHHVFEMFDFDGGNCVDLELFKTFVGALSQRKFMEPKLEKAIEQSGRDGLSYEEFISQFMKYFPNWIGKVTPDLEFAFSKASSDGLISLESLQKANQDNNLGYTEQELKAMIREFDSDQDGKVTLDEIKQRFQANDIQVTIEKPELPLTAPTIKN